MADVDEEAELIKALKGSSYTSPEGPELPRECLPPIPVDEQLDMMRNSELQLNLENPFEAIINEMVQLQRLKSQDYATDGDILNNMREVVKALAIPGYTIVEDCNAMVIRKTARITNLRGRPSSNESVRDSYLDRAVYAVLALVAVDEETGQAVEQAPCVIDEAPW